MDVVPEGNQDAWSREPFSGDIFKDEDDGMDYIFGRGAIDDKQAVSILVFFFKMLSQSYCMILYFSFLLNHR